MGVAEKGIPIGGVDERDPALGGAIEDGPRLRFVALDTKCHRPQANARHFEPGSTEPCKVHRHRRCYTASGDGGTTASAACCFISAPKSGSSDTRSNGR